MRGVLPVIFLLVLGFSGTAAAQEDNPWLEPGRAQAEIEACLAAAPKGERDTARDCGERYFTQCAEGGTWTTLAMNFCQNEVRGYWDDIVEAREREVVAKGSPQLTDWVEASRAAYETYREVACSRFRIPMGTMYGQMFAACYAQMALERAEALGDFLGEQPVIVPEMEE